MICTRKAYVTLATRDTYAFGCLILGNSLRKQNTKHALVVMITNDISIEMRDLLSSVYDEVVQVPILDGSDCRIRRPDLSSSLTKIECWNLTKYSKCVFLDCDTMVLQNCDELFNMEELSAAPDVGWPDCFNTGVFVYRPNNVTYEALITLARVKGSFDGGEQGLLNSYYAKDWMVNLNKRLSFVYNVVVGYIYSYSPAFKQFGSMTKIAHFVGHPKPWLANWLYDNGNFTAQYLDPNTQHPFLQAWFDTFRDKVFRQLPEICLELAALGNINTVWNLLIAAKTPELYRKVKKPKPEDTLTTYLIPLRAPPVYFEPPPPSYYISKLIPPPLTSPMPTYAPPPTPPPEYQLPSPSPPVSPLLTFKPLVPSPAYISLTPFVPQAFIPSKILSTLRAATRPISYFPALPPLIPELPKQITPKIDASKLPPSQLARVKGRIKARLDDAIRERERMGPTPPPLAEFDEHDVDSEVSTPSSIVPTPTKASPRPLQFQTKSPELKKGLSSLTPSFTIFPDRSPVESPVSPVSPRDRAFVSDDEDAAGPSKAMPPPPPPTPEVALSPSSTSGLMSVRQPRKVTPYEIDESVSATPSPSPSSISETSESPTLPVVTPVSALESTRSQISIPVPIRPATTPVAARPPALTYAPVSVSLPVEIESEFVLATFMDSAGPMIDSPSAFSPPEASYTSIEDKSLTSQPIIITVPEPTVIAVRDSAGRAPVTISPIGIPQREPFDIPRREPFDIPRPESVGIPMREPIGISPEIVSGSLEAPPSTFRRKPFAVNGREPAVLPVREPISSFVPEAIPSPSPIREAIPYPTREAIPYPTREAVRYPTLEPISFFTREPISFPTREPITLPSQESVAVAVRGPTIVAVPGSATIVSTQEPTMTATSEATTYLVSEPASTIDIEEEMHQPSTSADETIIRPRFPPLIQESSILLALPQSEMLAPLPPLPQISPYRQSLNELQQPQYSEQVRTEFHSDSASPIRSTSQARRQTVTVIEKSSAFPSAPTRPVRRSEGSVTYRLDHSASRTKTISPSVETTSSQVSSGWDEPGPSSDNIPVITTDSKTRKREGKRKKARGSLKQSSTPRNSTVTLPESEQPRPPLEPHRLRDWEDGRADYMGKDKFDNIQNKLDVLIKQRKMEDDEETEDELDMWEHEEEELEFDEDLESPEAFVQQSPPTGSSLIPRLPLQPPELPISPVPEKPSTPTDLPGYRINDFSGMREWESGEMDYTGANSSDSIMRRLDFLFKKSSDILQRKK